MAGETRRWGQTAERPTGSRTRGGRRAEVDRGFTSMVGDSGGGPASNSGEARPNWEVGLRRKDQREEGIKVVWR